MFDAHVHLQDSRLDACRAAVMEAAASSGVTELCCCGTSPGDWEAVEQACLTPHGAPAVWPAFGVHPWFSRSLAADWPDRLERFLAMHPKAPMGEIGMDGVRTEIACDVQLRVFATQLELAARMGRPVVLHGARAWGALLEALTPMASKLPGFVAHAFAGSADVLKAILALGGCVSFAGSVCSPRAARARAAAACVPADRLLVETDTPDLFPSSGISASTDNACLNQPANLRCVIAAIAELRRLPSAVLADFTAANARRVFFGKR